MGFQRQRFYKKIIHITNIRITLPNRKNDIN